MIKHGYDRYCNFLWFIENPPVDLPYLISKFWCFMQKFFSLGVKLEPSISLHLILHVSVHLHVLYLKLRIKTCSLICDGDYIYNICFIEEGQM